MIGPPSTQVPLLATKASKRLDNTNWEWPSTLSVWLRGPPLLHTMVISMLGLWLSALALGLDPCFTRGWRDTAVSSVWPCGIIHRKANFRRDKNKWHYETLHHSAPLAREMGFGLKTACLGISPCLLDLLAPPAGSVCLQQLLFVLYLLKKVEILYIIRIRHLHKWMRPVWFCLLILNPMWQVSWCEAFFPWNCRCCCLLFWQEFAYRREWRLSPKIYHPCYTSV